MIARIRKRLVKITLLVLFLIISGWQVSLGQTDVINNKISSAKEVIQPPSFKDMLSEHHFSISNEGVTDRNYFGNGYYYMNNFLVTGSVSVAKLPFKVQFLRQDYFSDRRSSTNTYQAQFDKDAFLDGYKKKLKETLKIDDLVPKDDLLENAKRLCQDQILHGLYE
jgi:hypothetical protein